MAISNNTPRNQYNANGVQTVFSYGFEIFEQADIKVYVGSTLLTLTTDYTVSGAGNPSGGNVTFLVAPANAEIVTFVRRVPRERTTDYQPNSKLDTNVINPDFDRIWAVIQETVDEEARVIRQAIEDGSASMVLPVEADRASKLLGFDTNGNVVVYEAGYAPASELGGHGLSMIRVNAGEDAYEFRTPTQVYTDIGANDASNLSTGTLSDSRLSSNVVSLTGTQTLTNKTISGATITGTTTLPGSGQISSGGNFTIGGTITQSTSASGEFINFASTAAATESAVRINTTSGTSGIGLKLSNSNLNIQSSMRLGSGGQFDFYTGQTAGGSTVSGSVALRVAHASSANDFVTISNSQNNGGHISVASSANSNARLYLSSLGTESVQFYTNNMATRQFVVEHLASATEYFAVGGGTSGSPFPYLAARGASSNVNLTIACKGSGTQFFDTGGGTQFTIGHTANAVNRISVTGAATTAKPQFIASGSDTNIGLVYGAKGSGDHTFTTAGGTLSPQFQITHTAGAVNYPVVSGAAAGGSPYLYFTGSDASVSGTFYTKGAAGFNFNTNGGTPQFLITHTANAVNYITTTGAATGNRVVIAAAGSDTNIGVRLDNKGTAVLALGGQTTGTTVGAAGGATALPATPTGYLTVTINGTDRKIPYYAT